jgi:hypothetical protein
MKKSIAFFLLALSSYCFAQVTVVPAPSPHFQFVDQSGNLLAGGFLYTYAAGTTTFLNTYADSTGTAQNPDPIPLDATGAPSNGTVETNLWLANASYKFCAYNSALVQQWCADNLTGYLGLLNLANTWTFQQTFTLPIIDTATDNQLVLGAPGNQMTLDSPPPTGNQTLHFPNTTDTLMGRATTDTETNKTLTAPVINSPTVNGCPVINSSATYVCVPNASSVGTVVNLLTKFTNTPSQAVLASTSDNFNIQGICVANCGLSGTATIQQSGILLCGFDNAVAANDWVVVSISNGGFCHDSGVPVTAQPPSGQQILGQSLESGGGSANYHMVLFPPGIVSRGVLCSGPLVTVNAATTAVQVINTCAFPSGSLNAIGKSFRMMAGYSITPLSTTSTAYFGMGTTTALTIAPTIGSQTSASSNWTESFEVVCSVTTAGSSGVLKCSGIPNAVGLGSPTTAGALYSISTIDLTGPVYAGTLCQFGSASSSNTCTGSPFVVEQLN